MTGHGLCALQGLGQLLVWEGPERGHAGDADLFAGGAQLIHHVLHGAGHGTHADDDGVGVLGLMAHHAAVSASEQAGKLLKTLVEDPAAERMPMSCDLLSSVKMAGEVRLFMA